MERPVRPASTGKRIAFLLPDMRGGGAELVALALMTEFVERGHCVDLVLMTAEGEVLERVPPAVRVIDLDAPRIRYALPRLLRYLRKERPDAVQVSMWPLTIVGILAHRLARSKARLVVSDHVSLTQQYGNSRWLRLSTRLFYPSASVRVCVSRGSADDLSRLSGISREAIEVVYNPIPGAPDPIPASAEAESLWGAAGPRILAVGTLKLQKNHALLIESFARLANPDARLMILGEGELRPALERLAQELGVGDRLAMPGFRRDLWPFYASADLFVLSSDYEGFGNVLVEAMHAGLSIVSTDCRDGPAEILANGEFGILVPVGDSVQLASAIELALSAPRQPERQKERARRFAPARAADEYLRLLLG